MRKSDLSHGACKQRGGSENTEECKLPLTAVNVVKTIVTDMAVIDVVPDKGLMLKEIAPGLTVEDVQNATEAHLNVSPDLKVIHV